MYQFTTMKKRIFAIATVLSLSIGATGCTPNDNGFGYEPTNGYEYNMDWDSLSFTYNETDYESLNYSSELNDLPKEYNEMEPLLQSEIMTIASVEMPYGYDTPNAFWYLLACPLMDQGDEVPGAEVRDESTYLTAEQLGHFAETVFYGYDYESDGLPPMPAGFTTVYYHADEELFSFPNDPLSSDMSIPISAWCMEDDETLHVIVTHVVQGKNQDTWYVDLKKDGDQYKISGITKKE